MSKPDPTINLPQGIRDILPAEAEKIVKAEGEILSTFASYGYKRIVTPMLEYMDVLDLGIGSDFEGRIVKFIDPSTGRLVAIRPDITPQIARMVATRMREVPRPLKLCYSENVLRYEDDKGGKIREVIQVGAEYVTDSPSTEADAEMVIMAIESLKKIAIKDFKIDIGEIGFAKALFSELGGDSAEVSAVKNAINLKDSAALEKAITKANPNVSGDVKDMFLNLPTLYGGAEVIEKAESLVAGVTDNENLKAELDKSLANLKSVVEILKEKGYEDFLTIDLGEIRNFDYYTGIIFEGFSSGAGKALLSGGRYDNLMERYGCVCSATGFAFDTLRVSSSKD